MSSMKVEGHKSPYHSVNALNAKVKETWTLLEFNKLDMNISNMRRRTFLTEQLTAHDIANLKISVEEQKTLVSQLSYILQGKEGTALKTISHNLEPDLFPKVTTNEFENKFCTRFTTPIRRSPTSSSLTRIQSHNRLVKSTSSLSTKSSTKFPLTQDSVNHSMKTKDSHSETIHKQLDVARSALCNMHIEKKDTQSKLSTLMEEKRRKEAENKSLLSELYQAQRKLSDLTAQNVSLGIERIKSRTTLTEVKLDEGQQYQMSKHEKRILTSSKNNETYKSKLNKYEQKLQMQKEEIERSHKNLSDVTAKRDEMASRLEDNKLLVSELYKQVQLQHSIQKQQQENIRQLDSLLAQKKDEVEKKDHRIKVLENDLNTSVMEISQLNSHNELVAFEVKSTYEAQERVKKLEKESSLLLSKSNYINEKNQDLLLELNSNKKSNEQQRQIQVVLDCAITRATQDIQKIRKLAEDRLNGVHVNILDVFDDDDEGVISTEKILEDNEEVYVIKRKTQQLQTELRKLQSLVSEFFALSEDIGGSCNVQ